MTRDEALDLQILTFDYFDKPIQEPISDEMALIVNKIYDDFESRTCESCRFYTKTNQKNHICNLEHDIWHLDRGCGKWEKKDD
jgi:hypothetical protein